MLFNSFLRDSRLFFSARGRLGVPRCRVPAAATTLREATLAQLFPKHIELRLSPLRAQSPPGRAIPQLHTEYTTTPHTPHRHS